MRIIPKNTKVSTEFFKGVTLADMIVGFIGVLVVFLIAVSSLPYRGYIAIGFAFILVLLLVRIDDESNYMFLFRIVRHFSYYRSYRKPGFEYPKVVSEEDLEKTEENLIQEDEILLNQIEMITEETKADDSEIEKNELDKITSGTSLDVPGDSLVLEKEIEDSKEKQPKDLDPLQLELKEEGFEILDLDDISTEAAPKKEKVQVVRDNKRKAPQSVWKNMRNKRSKAKKGDF